MITFVAEYDDIYNLIVDRYDSIIDMVALLKAYDVHGHSKQAIFKYEDYYDGFVDEVIQYVTTFINQTYNMVWEDAHFFKMFKNEFNDSYWLHFVAQDIYHNYVTDYDNDYSGKIRFDLNKLEWIHNVYVSEKEHNADFEDFVNTFDY